MRHSESLANLCQGVASLCYLLIACTSPFLASQSYVNLVSSIYVFATGLSFAASILSSRRAGVDYLLTFFVFMFLAAPAKAQIAVGLFPWAAQLSLHHIALSYGLLSISMLFYGLGLWASQRSWRPTPAEARVLTVEHGLFYSRWAWGLALFCCALAVVIGPTSLLSNRFGGQGNYTGFTHQFLFISRSVSLLAMVMMIYLARFGPSPRLRRSNLWAALVFLPIFLVINYIPALPRFSLFGMLIALSCPFIDYTRPALKVPVTMAALFILFAVFPVVKVIARDGTTLSDFLSLVRIGGLERIQLYMLNVDFDGFMQIVSTVQFLADEVGGIRWGNNFLGVALFFVPRALWPAKPIDTGEIVSVGLGYWYNNVASPLPAEALMGFGLLGPLLVFFLMGFVISRIELGAGQPGPRSGQLPMVFLYAVFMGFIIIIMRGALNGVAPQFASAFLAYGMMIFARRKRVVWRYAT